MNTYKVTCLKCGESDNILINDKSIINYEKGAGTNLLSGRYRSDMEWGWECICGNDNRISKQEESFVEKLVQKGSVEAIRATLKIDDKKQFNMRLI